jgi:hypothetical protein
VAGKGILLRAPDRPLTLAQIPQRRRDHERDGSGTL